MLVVLLVNIWFYTLFCLNFCKEQSCWSCWRRTESEGTNVFQNIFIMYLKYNCFASGFVYDFDLNFTFILCFIKAYLFHIQMCHPLGQVLRFRFIFHIYIYIWYWIFNISSFNICSTFKCVSHLAKCSHGCWLLLDSSYFHPCLTSSPSSSQILLSLSSSSSPSQSSPLQILHSLSSSSSSWQSSSQILY